jgi:hypothetical protein
LDGTRAFKAVVHWTIKANNIKLPFDNIHPMLMGYLDDVIVLRLSPLLPKTNIKIK